MNYELANVDNSGVKVASSIKNIKNYSQSDLGQNPSVNLATGRLRYASADLGVGYGNFAIGITHVYVSDLHQTFADKFKMFGANWKLNLSQCIIKEDQTVMYMDEAGEVHRFINFDGNRYYDERNAKTTLVYNSGGESVIEDGVGNKLYFNADGLLYKSVSCHNDKIAKFYIHNDGKLVTVYDGRAANSNGKLKNRIELVYSNDKLSSVTSYVGFTKIHSQLRYEYDGDNLIAVYNVAYNRSSQEAICKKICAMSYQGKLLSMVTDCETKSAQKFEYRSERISKITQGVLKCDSVALGTKDSAANALSLGMTELGAITSETFVPLKHNEYTYDNSESDGISVQTDITNENGITLTYFIDRNACITSSFEKVGNKLLKTLQKQGAKKTQTVNGTTLNCINNACCYTVDGSVDIVTKAFDITRDKLEQSNTYFNYSLWIKLSNTYSFAELSVTYQFDKGPIETTKVQINGYAKNAWQQVSVPITAFLKDGKVTSLNTLHIDLKDKTTSVPFTYCEIGFSSSPKSEMELADGLTLAKLKELMFTGFIDNVYVSKICRLGSTVYMTESDILATFANKYAHVNTLQDKKVFDVICNNGTKRLPNFCKITYAFDNGHTASMNNFVHVRKLTADNETAITTTYFFGDLDMTIKTTGTRDGKSSSSNTQTDYKGKQLSETDEYGVTKNYSYDAYGNITKVTVTDANNVVGAVTNYHYDDEGRLFQSYNGLTGQKITYDEYDRASAATECKVSNGVLQPTTHKVENSYGIFRDTTVKVSEREGSSLLGQNTITYDQEGRISFVTDGIARYCVKYNPVKEKTQYTQIETWGNYDEEVDIQTDSITRNTNGTKTYTTTVLNDKVITTVDAYDKVQQVKKNDEDYDYTYYKIDESSYLNKPSIITNGNVVTDYKYDYDGNLTGWTETENADRTYAIQQISTDVTKYSLGKWDKIFAVIERDKDKVLNPRITSLKYLSDLGDSYDHPNETPLIQIDYKTDSFGRATEKSNVHSLGKTATTTYGYTTVGGVTKLASSNYEGSSWHYRDQGNRCNSNYATTYTYGSDGKLTQIYDVLSWHKDYDPTLNVKWNNTRKYKYNSLNQLIQEEQNGVTTTYTYLPNGRLSSVNGVGYLYDSANQLQQVGNKKYFYDRYGNRRSEIITTEAIASKKVKEFKFRNNLLTEVSSGYVPFANYEYTVDGIRRKKIYNGITTVYALDGNKIVSEMQSGDGVPTTYGDPLKIIDYIYDTEGVAFARIGEIVYEYVKDALGNVVMVIDHDDGTVACLYRYDALGNCTVLDRQGNLDTNPKSVGNTNPFRWKGFYYDVETGFYYANGRYYDPKVGQYLNASPITSIFENAYTGRNLDRNGLMCNNMIELAGSPFTIFTATELHPDPTYDGSFSLPLWARITIGIGAIITGAVLTILSGGAAALPAYGLIVGTGAIIGAGFEAVTQAIAGNGFNIINILMAGLGGASAAGISFIAPSSTGYLGAFVFGGIGSVTGGIVTGNVNNGTTAGVCFALGGILNVIGKFIGTQVSNKVNAVITAKAQKLLANNPLVSMIGDTLEDLIGTANMNPIMQSSTNWLQSIVVNSMGGFSNSLIYILLREIFGLLITGWM